MMQACGKFPEPPHSQRPVAGTGSHRHTQPKGRLGALSFFCISLGLANNWGTGYYGCRQKNSYQETSSSSCHRGSISYRNKEQETYLNRNGDLFLFLPAIVRSLLHLILNESYFASALFISRF